MALDPIYYKLEVWNGDDFLDISDGLLEDGIKIYGEQFKEEYPENQGFIIKVFEVKHIRNYN